VLRVREGGEVTDQVSPTQSPYACMLGSPDRRTLFVATSGQGTDRIEIVRVDVPGDGLPWRSAVLSWCVSVF